jgi:type III secretory pathway component EscS
LKAEFGVAAFVVVLVLSGAPAIALVVIGLLAAAAYLSR